MGAELINEKSQELKRLQNEVEELEAQIAQLDIERTSLLEENRRLKGMPPQAPASTRKPDPGNGVTEDG